MKNTQISKFMVTALAVLLLFQMPGVPALALGAAETGESGGYIQAEEGTYCKHELGQHDETCGYKEGTEEVPCDMGCEGDEHAEGCAYVPAVPGTPCGHTEHDGHCGYDSGSCGPDVTYTFVGATGVLTISGAGAMKDYDYSDDPAPWDSYSAGIEEVVIDDGVISIGNSAFADCKSLSSVTIPNSVISIGNEAFYQCNGLTGVTIPNSVTSIGISAFADCTSLTSITVPNSVTSIDRNVFSFCMSLTSITIPNAVTNIDGYAFASCTSLTEIIFEGDTPPTIGEDAFGDIAPNGKVYYPNGATGYDELAASHLPAGWTANPVIAFQVLSAITDGEPVFKSTTAITLVFDVPVPLAMDWIELRGDYATAQKLQDEGDSKTEWVLEIENLVPKGVGAAYSGLVITPPVDFELVGNSQYLIRVSRKLTPTAPALQQLTPGDEQVMLVWSAPENPGDSAITGYQYSASTGDADWQDIPDSGPDTTTYTVTGLANGTEYAFLVRAVNDRGAGDASEPVNAKPQAGAISPSAPQNIAAVPGNEQIALSWTAPVNNGGSAITKYQVSASTGADDWQDIPDSDAATTSYTVIGLTNGTEYTCKVRAVNSVGEGAAATITATPSVPLAALTFSDSESYDIPASIVGVPITSINVSGGVSGGTAPYTFSATGLPDGISISTAGLISGAPTTAGVAGTATITVTDNANASQSITINCGAITPALTVPGVPQNFAAIPGYEQVVLSWMAPASNGGAPITKYEVSKDGGTSWDDASTLTGHTFTGLANGTKYTFKVRAVNRVGEGAASNAVTATPQAAPSDTAPTISGPTSMTLTEGYTDTFTGAFTITGNPQTGDFDRNPLRWLWILIPAAALTIGTGAVIWRRKRHAGE